MPLHYKQIGQFEHSDDAKSEKARLEKAKANKSFKYRVVKRKGKHVVEARKKTLKEAREEGLIL